MNKAVILSVCVLAYLVSASSSSNIPSWEEFKQTYGKAYDSQAEEARRQEIFHQNVEFIKRFESEEHTYSVGMNEFGDLTAEEFGAKFRKFKHDNRRSLVNHQQVVLPSIGDIPAEKDWRQTGCLTPVMNQGQCGSVWAIAAIELVQDMWCIRHGKLVPLSTQNLYDCTPSSQGCNGGFISEAFDYCLRTGIDSAASYPNTGTTGPCKAKQGIVSARCKFVHQIPRGNETALVEVVGTIGPVASAIEADQPGFQFYQSGVFSGPCGKNLDHEVLVVGYGGTGSQSYYILQNSWGSSWGAQGYMYLQRGHDLCGIADSAVYIDVQ